MNELVRRFFRLSLLNIAANLTVPLAGLVDTAMLGHLEDVSYLAGVSLASIIFDYIYWTFGFLRMATTGLTAQARGNNDLAETFQNLARPVLVSLVIAVVILGLQVPLALGGFEILSGTEAVKEAGRDYYFIRIWGAPAALVNFALIGWYLGREESGKALLMTLSANLTNVLFNYIFIIKLQMAARGAGLATMLSQYAMLAVGIVIYLCIKERPGLTTKQFFAAPKWRKLFRLNSDILLRTVCLVFSFSVFTNYSSALGVTILAVNSILRNLMVFAAFLIDGASFAVESLVGVFYGQGDGRRLKYLTFIALLAGLAYALVFLVLLMGWPDFFLSLFTHHGHLIVELKQYAWWLVPTLLLGSVAFIFDGFFLGLSRGNILRNTMLLSTVVFFPLAWHARSLGSNDYLWLSMMVFMGARALFTAAMSRPFLQGRLAAE